MLPTNTHILYPEFGYFAPTTLYEATELLAQYGDTARVMAGGTDLLVQMKMERQQPSFVVSLANITALKGIKRLESGELEIGPTTNIRGIYQYLTPNFQPPTSNLQSPVSNLQPPISNLQSPISSLQSLQEACNWFSTIQIMHMATVGGNLCNASPAADTAPPLLAFDARVTLKSKISERVLPLDHFFVAPGKTAAQPDEMLTLISIPEVLPNTGSAFLKVARVAADISQVCAAVRITREGNSVQDARIALGSVAPTPMRATVAERDLIGQTFSLELAEEIGKQAARETRPIGDVRATREYRLHIAAVIVRDALLRAWERTQ